MNSESAEYLETPTVPVVHCKKKWVDSFHFLLLLVTIKFSALAPMVLETSIA
jgi:hypothetical protein